MKVAIVYDWVNQWGGAERIVNTFAEIYPQADLYTAVFDPEKGSWAKEVFKKINTSFLDKLPWAKKYYFLYFWLMMPAFESFNFEKYDLVISITSFAGKSIITLPKTKFICYCLTPTRFLWQKESLPKTLKRLWPLLKSLRQKDKITAARPDVIWTTCRHTAREIKKIYSREAEIIYPGINLKKFKTVKKQTGDYFLLVSRLVEYKKVDLAIRVFNQLKLPLIIAGTGRQENYLKLIAEKNIKFLGKVSEKTLIRLYQQCKAVIYPQKEDFGLVPIEAQACGKPVIAYGQGGALETIIPGKTGEFFNLQSEQSLLELMSGFNDKKYNPEDCRKNAARFDEKRFIGELRDKLK